MSYAQQLGTPLAVPDWDYVAFVGLTPPFAMELTAGLVTQLTSPHQTPPKAIDTITRVLGTPDGCFYAGAEKKVIAIGQSQILAVDAASGAAADGTPTTFANYIVNWPEGGSASFSGVLPVIGSDTVWLLAGAYGMAYDASTRKLVGDEPKAIGEIVQGLPKTGSFSDSLGLPMQNLKTGKTYLLSGEEVLTIDGKSLVVEGTATPIREQFPDWPEVPEGIDSLGTGDSHGKTGGGSTKNGSSPIPPDVLAAAKNAQTELQTLLATKSPSVLNRSAPYYADLFKVYGSAKPTEPPFNDPSLEGTWRRFNTDASLMDRQYVVWIYFIGE